MRTAFLVTVFSLIGCSSTGVVPVGDSTFMIAKKSAQAGFGPPVKTEAAVYEEANTYCESQSKLLETVDKEIRNSTFGRPGSVNLKFRCVDSEGTKATVVEGESSRIDIVGGDSSTTTNTAESDDLYSKILKLDDLRQRGLITEEEYDQEKKELLDSN